jgi:hypothetical protein
MNVYVFGFCRTDDQRLRVLVSTGEQDCNSNLEFSVDLLAHSAIYSGVPSTLTRSTPSILEYSEYIRRSCS